MKGILATLVIATAIAQPLKAQDPPSAHWASDDWMGEVTFASANALLAGLDGRVSSAIALDPYSAGLNRTFLAFIPFRLSSAAPE